MNQISPFAIYKNVVLLKHLTQHLMIVFVNNAELRIFKGAKVIDVLQAYYRSVQQDFPDNAPVTLDQFGNIIEMDGEICDLKRIYTLDNEVLNENENNENF